MGTLKDSKKVIGVVLAGGRSSRMGRDKALLKIEALSMIERAEQLLANTSVDKVMISRNDDNSAHTADIIPHKGPLSGIHAIATRYIDCNLLVLPVDLPLMDADTLEQLIYSGKETGKNVRFGIDNVPLFIQNTAIFRQVIDYTLRCTANYSVKQLCTHFPLLELPLKTRSKMFNTNTPEQWRFAMQHFSPAHSQNTTELINGSFK
ncbi:MAG: hypothetical protein CL600_12835 [Alteromonas sp.]|nr:hypothetical protein [Alteromonas sp.]